MARYRVVEYQQHPLGVALSQILPESLQPAMRAGDVQILTGDLDLETANKIRNQRRGQIKFLGKRERVSVEIEEII